jgi:CheY-like chemotaxis protein
MVASPLFPIDLENIPSFNHSSSGPIAVVDDDVEQLEIISRYYAKTNRENELLLFNGAKDLEDYMDSVEEGVNGAPSLILLDINMPGTNGFQALKQLREKPGFHKVPIVVMFSVSQYQNDIDSARRLGADAYLTKPARASEYIRLFETL